MRITRITDATRWIVGTALLLAVALLVPSVSPAGGYGTHTGASDDCGRSSMGAMPGEKHSMGAMSGEMHSMGMLPPGSCGPAPWFGADVLGARIVNAGSEDLGKIDELLVDVSADHVAYAILTGGGVLEAGNRRYIVPLPALQWKMPMDMKGASSPSPEMVASMKKEMPRVMVLDVHRSDLKKLPQFTLNKWPNMGDHGLCKEIHDYYMRASRSYSEAARRSGSMAQRMYDGEGMPQYRRLSQLMGWTVINRDHARLGSLDDVALDLESGHTVYALVGHGASSGRSKGEAVIPWSALTIDREGTHFQVNATEGDLAMTTFTNLDLHECSTAAWIHQIFDQEPFWTTYGYVQSGSPGSGAGRSMGGE